MLLSLLFLFISFCAAVFIPAVKLGNNYVLASDDFRKQSKYRELLHNNNWPVNLTNRPREVGQEEWNRHLLRIYEQECPGIEAVWVPVTLWETFLAWQLLANLPPGANPKEPYDFKHDKYKEWEGKGTALELIHKTIGMYGKYLGIDDSKAHDKILTVLESRFLEFIGAEQPFYGDFAFYHERLVKLLTMMEAKAATMIPAKELRTYELGDFRDTPSARLQFLIEAFQDDFERFKSNQETLCAVVAKLEHSSLLADEYLIIRMSAGVDLYSEEGQTVKALDWTWKYKGREIFDAEHHHMESRQNTFQYGDVNENITDKRYAPQSYGYSLIAGGFLESFMPKGACCLAYAGYKNEDHRLSHGILYAIRFGRHEIDHAAAFLLLPKIPLQLGFFGFGEYFHPRLTTDVSAELYRSLDIRTDDVKEMDDQLHDIVNFFIAHASIVLQIDHRLILNEKDEQAKKLIEAQYKLANIMAIRQEYIDLQKQAKETYFSFHMPNWADLHPVLRSRINGIKERYNVVREVLEEMKSGLEAGKTMKQVCMEGRSIPIEDYLHDRRSWVKQKLCVFESDEKYFAFVEKAKILGIKQGSISYLLLDLIKSDWRFTEALAYDLSELPDWVQSRMKRKNIEFVPPPIPPASDIFYLYDECKDLGKKLDEYAFTIHQLG